VLDALDFDEADRLDACLHYLLSLIVTTSCTLFRLPLVQPRTRTRNDDNDSSTTLKRWMWMDESIEGHHGDDGCVCEDG
jgi:hypothetical protein